MAASVSIDVLIHEMRNQLAVAKANLEGLIDGKFTPTRERLLGIVQALSELDTLIEDLRVAGPNVGMPARQSLINVCELLNREYSAMDAIAAVKNIKFSIHRCKVASPHCMQFYGDPARIGQITKNVLLNAIRYTPSGGSVSVNCGHTGDELEVRISDTGPGLNKDEAEAVFAPGYRGTASAGEPGSGYGLSVVKQLVEEQGGTVTIDSASERGAAFTIRLPGVAPDST